MPLTFDVDGKTVKDPTPDDIAGGFASIKAGGMRSISMVLLERPPVQLWAYGHPKEGYTLDITQSLEPKGTETSKVTSLAQPIPQEEVIRIFQDFARGDDSWQTKFQWEPGITVLPRAQTLMRSAVILGGFVLLVLLLKYVLKLL
jgi:hypothetical protein